MGGGPLAPPRKGSSSIVIGLIPIGSGVDNCLEVLAGEHVFHHPGYYQPVQVFGINWGSCAVVRAAFHESGANVSVVRVVDGRHFRPTGFAPDEPCQEVEILDFLCHFLSVHWDLVQMKLYSLSAVWFPLWNLAVRFA